MDRKDLENNEHGLKRTSYRRKPSHTKKSNRGSRWGIAKKIGKDKSNNNAWKRFSKKYGHRKERGLSRKYLASQKYEKLSNIPKDMNRNSW